MLGWRMTSSTPGEGIVELLGRGMVGEFPKIGPDMAISFYEARVRVTS